MKEANDVLALLNQVSVSHNAAKADGVLNWMDLPKYAPVIAKANEAGQGSEKIPAEFKAATTEELVVWAQKALEAALALVAAVVSPLPKK